MRRTLPLLLAVAAALIAVSSVAAESTQRCKPTPEDAFGPFTQASPPLRAKIGTGHVLTGVVLSSLDCKPIRGARVEFRQANKRGVYTRAGTGAVLTNAAGRFRFEGPRPVSYEGRPPHIHIRVSAPNHEVLLTRYEPRGRRSGSVRLVLRPQQV
jgi:protocatechuate 3,4-dioxygenase beta subunit